mmetsp:Transcript_116137/g.335412  ORF Transcript_116137/g.335412 Transcript_116137/m.335412 type:complete len:332 (-) Transcript_116137:1155-2150(-)
MAYPLLCTNYYLSNHPSPWLRIRSFAREAFHNRFGGMVTIEAESGAQQADKLRRLDEYKGLRVMSFLYKAMKTALHVYKVYSKSTPVDISTVSKSGSVFSRLYENYLYYAHLILRMICKYSRLLRNFVNWRSASTYKFTMDLLILAMAWTLFPFKYFIIKWSVRALVWIILGPQNKIIDCIWIHPYYRTKEELLEDGIPETVEEMKEEIESRPNILDSILSSKFLHELGKSGRIVVEDNLKLQAAREARYGKFSESVPNIDASRFASVPAPSSIAQPYNLEDGTAAGNDRYYNDISPEAKIWSRVPGQKLYGSIIHKPSSAEATLPSEIRL